MNRPYHIFPLDSTGRVNQWDHARSEGIYNNGEAFSSPEAALLAWAENPDHRPIEATTFLVMPAAPGTYAGTPDAHEIRNAGLTRVLRLTEVKTPRYKVEPI